MVMIRSMLKVRARSMAAVVYQKDGRCFASDWSAMQEAFSGRPSSSSTGSSSAATRRDNSTSSKELASPRSGSSGTGTNGVVDEISETSNSGEGKNISDIFKTSLKDSPPSILEFGDHNQHNRAVNWSESFHGLGTVSFEPEIQKILAQPVTNDDVEITPDGLIYLPEIKYRRILNRAFGAGGWGLAPRSETLVTKNGMGGTVTREYALVCKGRLVSIARGEQDFFSEKGIPTATEGCKSNALMRCCKDLGIASELWDPKFIRIFKKTYCDDVFVEHVVNKRKKKIWKRKDGVVEYPFKAT
ncbi:hypothetical protein PACTADRAFT_50631 [Pachysolen tannophilus NRRL Y-2460]|uniref:Mitochondrial genome maintenance protein MGM101 n=1 Tax=Pachysolen tannophilus NRRL Y-2460 TaxID=669874 RepID=A0A1E4TSP8_PACTA|nr:hypothetical protein PACTADRAFT_50631 [Pachysolen tannophilus NRRL Y-2460]